MVRGCLVSDGAVTKITLEEHIATPGFPVGVPGRASFNQMLEERISDLERIRLPEMDEAGIAVQVLSLTWPGIQAITDPAEAVARARASNDTLASWVLTHPTRFAAFAALACQDPDAAADELVRCVEELGFVGAMVNGHTLGRYLDDPAYGVLWEQLQALDVPLYLHPTFAPVQPAAFAGYPDLGGSVWGWACETGSHALRLVASGLFDRYPRAKVILGHMGENLPFGLWRLDDRWAVRDHQPELELAPSAYIRRNFWVTTAGVCDPAPLRCTLDTMGLDRVLFSVDYPYQPMAEAARFIDSAPLSTEERTAVCHRNAARLLRLTAPVC